MSSSVNAHQPGKQQACTTQHGNGFDHRPRQPQTEEPTKPTWTVMSSCRCVSLRTISKQALQSTESASTTREGSHTHENKPMSFNPRETADQVFAGEEEGQEFSPQEKEKWLHKIRLLHGATGHGSRETLTSALQKQTCGVSGGQFQVSHLPRRVATLEVHPERWKVMLADGAHWVHPESKIRNVIGLYIDQCSRFLVGKVLVQHKTQLPDAQSYVHLFSEHLVYFGKPEVLRFDADEGTWRSKALDKAFSEMGIMMDPIPEDAHWHISVGASDCLGERVYV